MNSLGNALVVQGTFCQNVLVPLAVTMLAEVTLHDHPVRKFMRTIGVASTILGLIRTIEIPKQLNSWLWESKSPSSSCEILLAQATKDLLSCPQAQELWDEIEKNSLLTFRCTTADQAPAGALARVRGKEQEILVSEAQDEMITPILFGLNDLKHAERAVLIDQKKCTFSVDEYATLMEAVQYKTAKNTYELADSCISDGFWPESLPHFEEAFSGKSTNEDWTSYEGYLETQEKLAHTDLYRMAWYENCNPDGLSKWQAQNMAKWQALLKNEADPSTL